MKKVGSFKLFKMIYFEIENAPTKSQKFHMNAS